MTYLSLPKCWITGVSHHAQPSIFKAPQMIPVCRQILGPLLRELIITYPSTDGRYLQRVTCHPAFLFFLRQSLALCCSVGWSAVVQSQLTAASASQVRTILLPQPPK